MLANSLTGLLAAIDMNLAGHAVFSRHGVPLLLLPKDRAIAHATIRLYRPQTLKAKAAAAAVRCLCRFGLHHRFLPSFPGTSDKTGTLLCNPCHGIRIVAVRVRPDGLLEIVKAACQIDAEPLRQEHAALQRLQGKDGVPNVGPLEERNDAVWFSMPYLLEASREANPLPLLRAWETNEQEPAEQNGLICDLLPFLDERTRASLAGRSVRRALVHGDFAPWNWRADETGNLVCIDWEWAREDGFAGFDLVYCLVQQALLVKKIGKERLLAFISSKVSQLGDEWQSILAKSGLPLDLIISFVLSYRRSKGMD